MSEYPEHDKLTKVQDQTQAIGEFLEWVGGEKHARLMVWTEWNEPTEDDCPRTHYSEKNKAACPTCHGTDRYTRNVHHNAWLPVQGSTEELLAAWAGIDLAAVEREKRAMLARFQAGTGGAR